MLGIIKKMDLHAHYDEDLGKKRICKEMMKIFEFVTLL